MTAVAEPMVPTYGITRDILDRFAASAQFSAVPCSAGSLVPDNYPWSPPCEVRGAKSSEYVPDLFFKTQVNSFLVECEAVRQGTNIEIQTTGFRDLQSAINSVIPAEKRWQWFAAAIRDEGEGKQVQALGHIFRTVDGLLADGRFPEVDAWLSSISASQLSVNLIVGILSITRSASDRLLARQKFFDDAWKSVEHRGRNAARLLGGLRGRRPSDGAAARAGVPE